MKFLKNSANITPINDPVFAILAQAKKDIEENGSENVINATIGSLYDEENQLVAFDSVFAHYDVIDKKVKAAYASTFSGNPDYNQAVFDWVSEGHLDQIPHRICATPGGSGAISTSFRAFLEEGQTIILPNIGWSSYQLMASQNNLYSQTYEMFDQNHSFHINSLRCAMEEVAKTQNRVVVVINDPCHNPSGYTMTLQEWEQVIAIANEISQHTPVILINDIAYIDYSNSLVTSRDYLKQFNKVSKNILITIAFSCSKTLTSYGLRCGAAIILAQQEQDVIDTQVVFEKTARATWSNIPNAAMVNFAWVVNENKEAFIKEKDSYIKLMKQRSSLFLSEAKQCHLDYYPYKEGFFITLRILDHDLRDQIHHKLLENHIYTVKVNQGIRIAICSLPINKIAGLALKIKNIMIQI